MRLSFFLPALHGGGAERVTLTIADALAERGHRVELVLADRRGELSADVPGSITVTDLGRARVSSAVLPLRRHLRRFRPDVVISGIFHANLAAIAATRGLHLPLLVIEHNTMSAKVAAASSWRDRAAPAACAVAYRRADAVAAVSQGVADDLARRLRLPRRRIRVLPNPVDYAAVRRLAAQPARDWGSDGIGVLAVGRLTAQKDFATLLRAVAIVPTARLLVLGEGEERARLGALADELGVADRVELAGFEPNPYRWFARADVIALSSRWEGLPTVLLEALPFPARIVATDCRSGPREILDDGRWGRLVPVGDAAALAAAITAAAAEPEAERDQAWRGYDRSAVVTRYERLLAELAAGSAPAPSGVSG
ncbi:MAG: glycosyltransferase [Nocardioides sp.]|uniref:glycosyltransferase n=1 Tax=Nocardioides sp. TaxID=35761 RepID=UPI0039E68D3D